jgi:hypothetical protein
MLILLLTVAAPRTASAADPPNGAKINGEEVTLTCGGTTSRVALSQLNEWRTKEGEKKDEKEPDRECAKSLKADEIVIASLYDPVVNVDDPVLASFGKYSVLREAAGTGITCNFVGKGDSGTGDQRCKATMQRGGIAFELLEPDKKTRASGPGKITLTLGDKAKTKLDVAVASCTFATSDFVWVRGARSQVVPLTASPGCDALLTEKRELRIEQGSTALLLTREGQRWVTHNVGATLASTTTPLSVTSDGVTLGRLNAIIAVDAPTAGATLAVTYPLSFSGARSHESGEHKAVVDPLFDLVDKGHVTNTATMTVASELLSAYPKWCVATPNAALALTAREPFDPRHVTFAVRTPTPDPWEVILNACRTKSTTSGATSGDCGCDTPDLSIEVTLATSSVRESIPLSIADALYVVCQAEDYARPDARDDAFDVATNNANKAIETTAVSIGACRLVFDPSRLAPDVVAILAAYGPQLLEVTTTPAGTPAPIGWRIDLDSRFQGVVPEAVTRHPRSYAAKRHLRRVQELPLKLPSDVIAADYTVDVTLGSAGAAYGAQLEGTTGENTDRKFHVRLHPRGAFGWRNAALRTFVTATVTEGLRLPASPSRITHSRDPSSYQGTGPRLGTLLVVEPWDYDASTARFPFAMRFVTGVLFDDATRVESGAAWVTGVGTSLPFLDTRASSPSFQTAVSVHVLWEADHFNVAHESHLLGIVALEAGALFGAK